MEDENNPFLLHHSDNPGLVLVSQPLTKDNYDSCKRAITMALINKNKMGFFDCSIIPPSQDDAQYRLWLCNNNIVASWLLNSISKDITASVISSTTATDIWIYGCLIKIKSIWEGLGVYKPHHNCHRGGVQPLLEYLHSEYVQNFLMELNEPYSHIWGQILMMNPIPKCSL